MNAKESGAANAPIILTRDPSWGTGPAVICGSEALTDWTKGADNSNTNSDTSPPIAPVNQPKPTRLAPW